MLEWLHRAVGAATVGDADDKYDQFVVEQLIHNAVVADAQAAQTAQPALEDAADQRLFAEPIDGMDQTRPGRLGDTGQFSSRAAFNPNRVAHA